MKNLFENDEDYKKSRKYNRDLQGRFADKKDAELIKYKHQAAIYKKMYERELSRNRGFSFMIRYKDNLINKLKWE